jgi:hypothetical protein
MTDEPNMFDCAAHPLIAKRPSESENRSHLFKFPCKERQSSFARVGDIKEFTRQVVNRIPGAS